MSLPKSTGSAPSSAGSDLHWYLILFGLGLLVLAITSGACAILVYRHPELADPVQAFIAVFGPGLGVLLSWFARRHRRDRPDKPDR